MEHSQGVYNPQTVFMERQPQSQVDCYEEETGSQQEDEDRKSLILLQTGSHGGNTAAYARAQGGGGGESDEEEDTMSEYNGPEDPQAPQMANQDPEVQLLEVHDIKTEECTLPYQIIIAQAHLDELNAKQKALAAKAKLAQKKAMSKPKKPRDPAKGPRPTFPCSECDYAATTNSYLKMHKQIRHEGIKFPYTPANCYATVTLDAAGNVVKNQKIRQCDQCPFVAFKASSMKHHRRTKHEGKLFPCDLCEYQGTTSSNTAKHKMSKHEGVRYPCNECDYAATLPSDLVKHVRNKHDGIRHACGMCQFESTTTSSLRQHIRYKHEGIRFQCDRCDYGATTSSNLTKHKLSSNCLLGKNAEKGSKQNNMVEGQVAPTPTVQPGTDTKIEFNKEDHFLFPLTSMKQDSNSSSGPQGEVLPDQVVSAIRSNNTNQGKSAQHNSRQPGQNTPPTNQMRNSNNASPAGHPPQNARGPTPGGSNQRGGGIDGILAAAVPGSSGYLPRPSPTSNHGASHGNRHRAEPKVWQHPPESKVWKQEDLGKAWQQMWHQDAHQRGYLGDHLRGHHGQVGRQGDHLMGDHLRGHPLGRHIQDGHFMDHLIMQQRSQPTTQDIGLTPPTSAALTSNPGNAYASALYLKPR